MEQRTVEYKLRPKQLMFCNEYINNKGNWTKAALFSYNTTDYSTANAIATENLQKPAIKAYLADKWHIAGNVIMQLVQDKKTKDAVRMDWAKFVYEQVYGKASQKVEHQHSWHISLGTLYQSATWTKPTEKTTTTESQTTQIIDAIDISNTDE